MGKVRAVLFGVLVAGVVVGGLYWRVPEVRVAVGTLFRTDDGIRIWRTDSVFGYRHVRESTGRHSVTRSFDVVYTIDENGNRVTPSPGDDARRILTLGGSFTFGHGVEDHEAWPSVLGNLVPEFKIVNRSVSGWGTAHALLALEEELEHKRPPALVLYGWISDHRRRNYIRRSFVDAVGSYGRRHPYFELRDGRLDYRGIVDPKASVDDATPGLLEKERVLTTALVARIDELCRSIGAPFVFLRLREGDDDWLLSNRRFRALDLADVPGGQLPSDQHGNAAWHANVASRLVQDLPELSTPPHKATAGTRTVHQDNRP